MNKKINESEYPLRDMDGSLFEPVLSPKEEARRDYESFCWNVAVEAVWTNGREAAEKMVIRETGLITEDAVALVDAAIADAVEFAYGGEA